MAAITPKQAMESNVKQTVDSLEVGINQQLDNEYTGDNEVKVSLSGQSEKVIQQIVSNYMIAGWTIKVFDTTLVFSAVIDEET